MANEVRAHYPTGQTLYAVAVRGTDGQAAAGVAFEVPLAGHWATYAVALAEQSTTGLYYGTFPAVAAGLYDVFVFLQTGGSPATTDVLVGQAVLDWSGSADVGDPLTNAVPGSYGAGTAGYALGRIGTAPTSTTIVSPVSAGGDASVIAGDAYFAADGRSLDWTDSGQLWPDLTGGSVLFVVVGPTGTLLSQAGTVVTPSGSLKKVRLELSSSTTAGAPLGTWHVYALATLSDGHPATLVQAKFTVRTP